MPVTTTRTLPAAILREVHKAVIGKDLVLTKVLLAFLAGGHVLNEDTMLSIMMEQKKPEKNDITLSGEKLRKYFPRSYTPFQIENTIFKLLDAWQKKRQRDQSR